MEDNEESGIPALRFGEFVLDFERAELRRSEERIALKPQPLKLLHMLASGQGRLVRRDEIRAELWPDATFVDYDNGINSCVRQIRRALDDDSDTPQFIETVPRRGYRFIGRVEPFPRSRERATVGSEKEKRIPALVGAAAVMAAVVLGFVSTRTADPPAPAFTNPMRLTSAEGVESFPAWSPDGNLLAYTIQSDAMVVADTDIWVVPSAGGEPLNRTTDYIGVNNFPSWVPDGSALTFRSDRDGPGIYAMPALAGGARKLLEVGDVVVRTAPAVWSSDGSRVALSSADDDGPYVEIVTLRTGESRRLDMPTPGYYFDLSWSPDEALFAYIRSGNRRSDVTSVWIVRESDGMSFRVTGDDTTEWNPSWSTDPRTLFFVSDANGVMDLWQQRLGETGQPIGEPERLTSGMEIRRAAFSPNGDRVALVRGTWNSKLWRVPIFADRPATWADAERVTTDESFIRRVSVTADGARIAVSSNRQGDHNLWLVDEDNALEPITEDGIIANTIDWSSDGEALLFSRFADRSIWILPSMGGKRERLTGDDGWDSYARWSPDDSEVVFLTDATGQPEVFVVSAKGGTPRQVTDLANLDGTEFVKRPDWSPDGRWLSVIVYRPSTGPRLYKVAVEGDALVTISSHPIWNYVWADSGEIYFTVLSSDLVGNIWAMSEGDVGLRPLTDLDGKPGILGGEALATDSRFLYFTWEEDVGDIWTMDVSYH